MKILIQHKDYYPLGGGIETYIKYLSRELIKMGHSVTVLCSLPRGYKKLSEIHEGVKIIRYIQKPVPEKFDFLWPLYVEKSVDKYMQNLEKEFDVIISRYPVFLGPSLKRYPNKKLIYIVPSVAKTYNKTISKFYSKKMRIKLAITGRLIYEMEKNAVSKFKIIALSNSVKKQLMGLYKINAGRISVISPGIDAKKYKFAKNGKGIVSAGRLEPGKNFRALIEMLDYMKTKPKLTIAGGGEQETELKKLATEKGYKENVKITGWKSDISKYLRKSKIFVFPSVYEGFGHVLLEAMASGLPCIAFKPDGKNVITANNDIIKNGKNGYLASDIKQMAEKVELLLNNEKLRKKMARYAIMTAKKYSWKKTAVKVMQGI